MRFALGTMPPHTLTDEETVVPCLAPERCPRFTVVHVLESVLLVDVFLGLPLEGIGSLVGVELGIVAQPRESEEVPHVELESHGLVSHLARATFSACS